MSKYFGTDGIRGEVNKELTYKTLYSCGNALGQLFPSAKVLLGYDTRLSNQYLSFAFSLGAINAGIDVVDIGIITTPAISYLVSQYKFDFGVVITASHNPAIFNGIKIFNKDGVKISSNLENKIEQCFTLDKMVQYNQLGKYTRQYHFKKEYIDFLSKHFIKSFLNVKVVLDCANGATYNIAPKIFRTLGIETVVINNKPNGLNINQNCGATNVTQLQQVVLQQNADWGFAFDGDGDRIVVVDKTGAIFDGDKLLYFFAVNYAKEKLLISPQVVGTIQTNMGVENALLKHNIALIRTDVGDKNVEKALQQNNLLIGAEQSGHIILRDKLVTGDGILTALQFLTLWYKNKLELNNFFDFNLFSQVNKNIYVKNKEKMLNNEDFINYVNYIKNALSNKGRINVRASGTEPCLRVMVETNNQSLSEEVAQQIVSFIKGIDK